MKHRRNRHVNILLMHAPLSFRSADRSQRAKRVQNQLTMTEVDAFWHTGRAGGVEGRRAGVLIEIREVELGGGSGQKLLILACQGHMGLRRLVAVVKQNEVMNSIDTPLDRFQNR